MTTWICHVRSDVFGNGRELIVRYIAQMENAEGQAVGRSVLEGVVEEGWPPVAHIIPKCEIEYSRQWCALVFKHNTFEGSPESGKSGMPGTCVEVPLDICVTVHLPSAHERAEALLSLSEWLDGKVSEEEKQQLLHLSEEVQT